MCPFSSNSVQLQCNKLDFHHGFDKSQLQFVKCIRIIFLKSFQNRDLRELHCLYLLAVKNGSYIFSQITEEK